jgi:hypothetical protein
MGDFLYVSKGFRLGDRTCENAGTPRRALYPPFLSFRPNLGPIWFVRRKPNKTRVFREFRARPVAAVSNPLTRSEKTEMDVAGRKDANFRNYLAKPMVVA